MIIGVIGDIHQNMAVYDKFEKFKEGKDKVVFLGDYVDSWDSGNTTAENNALASIKRAIQIKRENPDLVELLIGNHDIAYIDECSKNISGHQNNFNASINEILQDAKMEFKPCVEIDGWTFSHAGVTSPFADRMLRLKGAYNSVFEGIDDLPLHKYLTVLYWVTPRLFEYYDKDMSGYGNSAYNTPLWVRPPALLPNMAMPKQVVGHTEVGPKFLQYKDNKLIIIDSPTHDSMFVLDTENLPEFENVEK